MLVCVEDVALCDYAYLFCARVLVSPGLSLTDMFFNDTSVLLVCLLRIICGFLWVERHNGHDSIDFVALSSKILIFWGCLLFL